MKIIIKPDGETYSARHSDWPDREVVWIDEGEIDKVLRVLRLLEIPFEMERARGASEND